MMMVSPRVTTTYAVAMTTAFAVAITTAFVAAARGDW